MAATAEFHVYGPVGQLWTWLEDPSTAPTEAIVEGPAGTGKTRPICEWWVNLCEKYAGTRLLFCRKTRVSMNNSVLDTLEAEVLGETHPIVLGGPSREHRPSYKFSNGSQIDLGGMDNPTRLFSTQYHGIWPNECQEFTLEEWESLHRALRRPGGPGFHLLLGDCNPDSQHHWANKRMDRGVCQRIETRHWHNPSITPEYIERLSRNLSGVRRARLFKGLWVSAEGQVWPEYDHSVHVIAATMSKDGWGRWQVEIPSWGDSEDAA